MDDLGGLLGGLDLGTLLGAAQSMQQQMVEAQAALAETVVEGRPAVAWSRSRSTGDFRFRSVHIAPDAVDPDDPTMLEDLVLAALARRRRRRSAELQAGATRSVDGPGGLGLGGRPGRPRRAARRGLTRWPTTHRRSRS